MAKTLDLKEMSVEALKALAYDQIAEANRIQTNLQVINAEIAKRNEVIEPEKVEEK